MNTRDHMLKPEKHGAKSQAARVERKHLFKLEISRTKFDITNLRNHAGRVPLPDTYIDISASVTATMTRAPGIHTSSLSSEPVLNGNFHYKFPLY